MNAKTPIRLLATLFVCLAMQTVITGAEADLPGPDIGSKAPEFTLRIAQEGQRGHRILSVGRLVTLLQTAVS
jgi:hypothetical protein